MVTASILRRCKQFSLFIFQMHIFRIKIVVWVIILSGTTSGQENRKDDVRSSSPAILGSSSPPTVATDRGQTTHLKCVYSGDPEPKVNWLKAGKEVRHDCQTCIASIKTDHEAKTTQLEITPYEKEDFGEYECRVRNQYGSAKLKINLRMSGALQSKCQRARATSTDPRRKQEFRPICNEDGTYHEVQCSIEHQTCWCVNKHGKKTLDVVAGIDGLHCFKPKDLSVVSIFVFVQGIIMAVIMIGYIIEVNTDNGITRTMKTGYEFLKEHITVLRQEFKYTKLINQEDEPRKRKDRKKMRMRKLPSLPAENIQKTE